MREANNAGAAEMKFYCKGCDETKPVTEFGRSRHVRSRRTGVSFYCRKCLVRKTKESRIRARIKRKANVIAQPPPLEKVRRAVADGYATREGIRRVTNLSLDEVCDCLALLAFETNELRVKGGQFYLRRVA